MTNRKQKVGTLMEALLSLRRTLIFKATWKSEIPRITPAQWAVLSIIDPSGKTTVKDVAHTLGISSSAATQLIDVLARRGYVIREQHSEDRRKVTLVLPTKTKKRIEHMKRESIRQLLKIFDVLDEKEINQFIQLTNKVVSRF